ncbi:hypothetical protein [Serratia proteamaculans]|uniref:hypothetical protein n=1 Tax=Serratia proteamaculans TaxID=28151 RepID=UPI002177BA32|nr:hypothetical protein [Serratia proteamaculans]CAI1046951.1 Uncharacterised protein [Serratia proteamaculans]CAI2117451.1 Uncharacterised protein [Serratia proteamaculans]
MSQVYCICPQFLGKNISDTSAYENFFLKKIYIDSNQMVIDKGERIIREYIKEVKNDKNKFSLYNTWITLIKNKKDKILISDANENENIEYFLCSNIINAVTSHDKKLVTSDNMKYKSHIEELKKQQVELVSMNNIDTMSRADLIKSRNISHMELESDIDWALHNIIRFFDKTVHEDKYTDHLRQMLSARYYEIVGQSREGLSGSMFGLGELDLAIESKGYLFAIIEAIRLNSLDKANINSHYNKLIHNYNRASIPRLYLTTYYIGNNFSDWWEKYKSHIENIKPCDLSVGIKTRFTKVEYPDPQDGFYTGIKKLYHYGKYETGQNFMCVHQAVNLKLKK